MAEEETREPQAKKSPLVLFIVVGILLVAGSIGGTVFFLNSGGEEEVAEVEVEPSAIYFAINPTLSPGFKPS